MPEVVRRKADFTDLRLFWAVAEAGSFGAAARALGVSASTLTRAVDNLESRLATKLLVRGKQGVSLTPAGTIAYQRVQVMERAAAALEAELVGHDRAPSGTVKVSAPDGIAGVFITPTITEFLRGNPDIDLVLDCGLWADRPLEGEVDVGLTFSKPSSEDMVVRPLAYFHYALFAARSHLDLYGMPKHLQEALSHPYVHHVAQVHQRDDKSAAYQLMTRHRLVTNSSAVSLNAVREGAGLHALPTAILSVDPTLVMLEGIMHGPVTMWLVQRREVMRSSRVKRAVAWLEDIFDQATQPWYREEYVPPADFQTELEQHFARRKGRAPEPSSTPSLERA
ncbi:MAG: LysR family transcriptional regulator [Parcubacteria group bacterium]